MMNLPKARLGILEFTQSVLGISAHDWQRKTLAHIEAGHPTALTACNGAGKTSTVFVAAALWCLFNWPRARIVVTSASWSQLRKQFFDVIRERRFHPLFRHHNFNASEVRTPEGGFVIGLSVDEAGKAEGCHERLPDSPVMILADEAKSIRDDVFTSLARCTPAAKPQEFANLDAERWFSFRRALEKRILILPPDQDLMKQLSSRRLQYDHKARIQLEPKDSLRVRGLPSPDRADAVIGAAAPLVCSEFSGAITSDRLAGMRFGGLSGSRTLFDCEPVTFR
jgi:hypothetical protein